MIQTLSKKITENIFNVEEDKESFIIHQYGVEVIISLTIDIFLVLGTGYITKHLIDAIIYLFIF